MTHIIVPKPLPEPELPCVWVCQCGAETPCRAADTRIGAVFQCPKCQVIWGCLYPKGGGRAWVRVNPQEAEFHHLLGRPRDEEDEA